MKNKAKRTRRARRHGCHPSCAICNPRLRNARPIQELRALDKARVDTVPGGTETAES